VQQYPVLAADHRVDQGYWRDGTVGIAQLAEVRCLGADGHVPLGLPSTPSASAGKTV
jgi:hypothetical protein